MKVFTKVLAILAAIAAVAGAVFIIATYGDKIVAWAKSLLEKIRRKDEFIYCEDEEEEAAEEEESVQAEESDFQA